MKRILLATAVLINSALMIAQTDFDALHLMQSDINGTARYMGMAGAMGALGGDASAIKDNPAGLGVYRKSELTGTFNTMMQSSVANWNSDVDNSGGRVKSSMNNLTFVIASNSNSTSGLVASNWAFGFNRLRTFDREVRISQMGFKNPTSIADYILNVTNGHSFKSLDYVENSYDPYYNENVPWISVLAFDTYLISPNLDSVTWNTVLANNQLVRPSYLVRESGYMDEYSLSWGGNFDNKLHLGISGNIRSLNHTKYSSYIEDFDKDLNLNFENTTITKGAGLNLNIGAIYRPIDAIRFGVSVRTPTLYALEREHFTTLAVKLYNNTTSSIETLTAETPKEDLDGNYVNVFDFKLNDPLKVNASLAFVFGKVALLSLEYDYDNYQAMRLMTKDNSLSGYSLENKGIASNLNSVGTYKIGGELKLTQTVAFRAGYATTLATTKKNAVAQIPLNTVEVSPEFFLHNQTSLLTLGLGYRNAGFFADFALAQRLTSETFVPYNIDNVIKADVLTLNSNIVLTVGLRF
jgi:hypothetical protein